MKLSPTSVSTIEMQKAVTVPFNADNADNADILHSAKNSTSATENLTASDFTEADFEKRLALFLPAMYGGGAERIMLNLAQGIASRGFKVDLVVGISDGPLLEQVPQCVNLVELGASRSIYALPALIKYLRRVKPYAMLTALNRVNLMAIWAKRLTGYPTRLVVTEHNTLSVGTKNTKMLREKAYPMLANIFYPWADGIVGVSQGVSDDLAKTARIKRERIQVIYNPVITDEMRKKAAAPLKHPWVQPGEPPVILAIGRLSEQKNFSLLLNAFSILRKQQPVRLIILGEGPLRAELEAQINSLNITEDISLPGWVENPYAYMMHTDALVLSSSWEGLPTVLIEALYCQTNIISTDCPNGPQEVLAKGKYGQIVPMNDADALAQAMEKAISGNAPRPTDDSYAPYEMDTVVNQYVNIMLHGSA